MHAVPYTSCLYKPYTPRFTPCNILRYSHCPTRPAPCNILRYSHCPTCPAPCNILCYSHCPSRPAPCNILRYSHHPTRPAPCNPHCTLCSALYTPHSTLRTAIHLDFLLCRTCMCPALARAELSRRSCWARAKDSTMLSAPNDSCTGSTTTVKERAACMHACMHTCVTGGPTHQTPIFDAAAVSAESAAAAAAVHQQYTSVHHQVTSSTSAVPVRTCGRYYPTGGDAVSSSRPWGLGLRAGRI